MNAQRCEYAVDPSIIDECNADGVPTPEEILSAWEELGSLSMLCEDVTFDDFAYAVSH